MDELIKNIDEWEVMTPTGWSNFSAIKKIKKNNYYILKFDNDSELIASSNHKIKMIDGDFKYVNDIVENEKEFFGKYIIKKTYIEDEIELFDLLNVEKNNEYITNDLISHNCAFIEQIDTIWTAAAPAVTSHGSACTILSCVTKGTYLYTNNGIEKIDNYINDKVIVGDYYLPEYNILGKNILRSGVLFHNNGYVNTKKIITSISELEGSYNHKVWAYKNDDKKYDWYTLENLNIGDYIAIQYNMNCWGNNDSLSDFINIFSNKVKFNYNFNTITTDLAYLFGLYISEGSSYIRYNLNGDIIGGSITITCGDDITQYLDKLNLSYHKNKDGIHYTISSTYLIQLFKHIGFDLSKHAHEKIIPDRLLQMSKENIKYLIRGIMDGDGFSRTDNGVVGIGVTSEELIKQISLLLLNFGIICKKTIQYKDKKNKYNGKIKHNYNTYILWMDFYNSKLYYDIVGFNFKRKQNNIIALKKYKLNRPSSHDIIPNSCIIFNHMYNASGENTTTLRKNYNLVCNGYINKKTKFKSENISRDNIIKMYNISKNNLTSEDIFYYDKIISENIIWSKINKIENLQNYTYDFSLPDTDDFWGHSIIYNSIVGHQTPNGVGNFFHKTWIQSEDGKTEENSTLRFNTIKLPWTVHPERDQKWRDMQIEILGSERRAAQECDASFLTSGHTVITAETIAYYKETMLKNPIEKRYNEELWLWEYPDYTKDYVVCADVARGDGGDYSAFHILDVVNLKQIGEYKGQIGTLDFAKLLVNISREYNNALLVIENANIGWSTVLHAIEVLKYENIYYSLKTNKQLDAESQILKNYDLLAKEDMIPGFTTSPSVRPLIISKFETYMREKEVIIQSKRTMDEITTFVWLNNKPQAMRGYNDDLIMSLCIGLWVRDTALMLRQTGIDLTKSSLSAIKKVTAQHQVGYNSAKQLQYNPYQLQTGTETEDFSWIFDNGQKEAAKKEVDVLKEKYSQWRAAYKK